MSKTIIVANTKRQADMIAKYHNLHPWTWRYAFNADSLRGLNPEKTVILMAANWHDPNPGIAMFREVKMLQALGAEVIEVVT